MEEMQKYMHEHVWRYMFMSPSTGQADDESIVEATPMDVIKDESREAGHAMCDYHEATMIRMQYESLRNYMKSCATHSVPELWDSYSKARMPARRYVMHMEPKSRRVDRLRVDPILGLCSSINPEWDEVKAAHNIMVSRMRMYATLPTDPHPAQSGLMRVDMKFWRRPINELIKIIDNGSEKDMFTASRVLMFLFCHKSEDDECGYADIMLDTIKYKIIQAAKEDAIPTNMWEARLRISAKLK